MPFKPVVLCILDGWGLRDEIAANAVALAETPNFDRIWAECPRAELAASGEAVGLPPGQIGNSEVGHTNIGAGRVVWMDLPRIDQAIESGAFFERSALVRFIIRMKESGGTAHLAGLVSDGGVHSHRRHVAALARALSRAEIPVAIHAFTDGRDVGPTTGREALAGLLRDVSDMPGVRVASVCGRFHAMDRDERWERVERAFRLLADGEGASFEGAIAAIEAAYDSDITDEFVEPAAIDGYRGMRDGDGLVCANFRADRVRQLLGALLDPNFDAFDRSSAPEFAATLGMVGYSSTLDPLMPAMFPPETIVHTLGEWMAKHGKRQLRLAETEKYAHVTFFLNGGAETPDRGEDRHMAPSPKVRTYDLAPAMSAREVGDKLVEGIRGDYDLIVVNFANPDMVGHTGSLEAAMAACEAVDVQVGRALDALDARGGAMLVTADHGNAERMATDGGGPHTAHTTNPVPLVLVRKGGDAARCALADGRLADIAPTILSLMDMEQPDEMTGRSLLRPPPR